MATGTRISDKPVATLAPKQVTWADQAGKPLCDCNEGFLHYVGGDFYDAYSTLCADMEKNAKGVVELLAQRALLVPEEGQEVSPQSIKRYTEAVKDLAKYAWMKRDFLPADSVLRNPTLFKLHGLFELLPRFSSSGRLEEGKLVRDIFAYVEVMWGVDEVGPIFGKTWKLMNQPDLHDAGRHGFFSDHGFRLCIHGKRRAVFSALSAETANPDKDLIKRIVKAALVYLQNDPNGGKIGLDHDREISFWHP